MPRGVTLGPRFRDGLGVRVVEVDKTSGDTVEVLRLCPELCAFEKTIKDRTDRLSNFRHPRFVPVRGVQAVSGSPKGLGVIADHIVGPRLSEVLEAARKEQVAVDTNAALHLIKELLSAISVLHESRKVTHGAIAPERLLVTPRGRLVIVDYTLGLALERLQYSRARLWSDFHIAMPPTAGAARFDQRADVVQIGTLAVALLLGRPLDTSDYTNRLQALLDGAGELTVQGEGRPLSPALHSWLERALPLEARKPFATAQQAYVALEQILTKERRLSVAPAALRAFISRYLSHSGDRATDTQEPTTVDPGSDVPSLSSAVIEADPEVEGPFAAIPFEIVPEGVAEIVPEVIPGIIPTTSSEATLGVASGIGSDITMEVASGIDSEFTVEVASGIIAETMVEEAPETTLEIVPETTLGTVPDSTFEIVPEIGPGDGPGVGTSDATGSWAPAGDPVIPPAEVQGVGGFESDPERILALESDLGVAPKLRESPAGEAEIVAALETPSPQTGGLSLPARDDAVSQRGLPAESPAGRGDQAAREQREPVAEAGSDDVWVIDPSDLTFDPAFLDGLYQAPRAGLGPPTPGPLGKSGVPPAVKPSPPAAEHPRVRPPGHAGETESSGERLTAEAAVTGDAHPASSPATAAAATAFDTPSALEAMPLADADEALACEGPAARVECDAQASASIAALRESLETVSTLEAARPAAQELSALVDEAVATPLDEAAAAPVVEAVAETVAESVADPFAEDVAPEEPPALSVAPVLEPLEVLPALDASWPFVQESPAPVADLVAKRVSRSVAAPAGAPAADLIAVPDPAPAAVPPAAPVAAAPVAGIVAEAVALPVAEAIVPEEPLDVAAPPEALLPAEMASGAIGEQAPAPHAARPAEEDSGIQDAVEVFERLLDSLQEEAAAPAVCALPEPAGAPLGVASETPAGPVEPGAVLDEVSGDQAPLRGQVSASAGARVLTFESPPVRGEPTAITPTGEAPAAPASARLLISSARETAARLARIVPRRLIDLGHTRLHWKQTSAAALVLIALGGVRLATAYWFKAPPPTGDLIVETVPDGLEVFVDNALRGRTPMSVTLLAGDHVLELRGKGLTRTLPVRIVPGIQTEERLSWPLSARTGRLRVESEPTKASVSIDGQPRGVTPLTIEDLPARIHTLVVQGRGGRVERSVTIDPEQTTTVKVPVFPGWMKVFSPFDLQIFEGGRLLGRTDVDRIMLRAGRHVVEFVNEELGYRAVRQVDITPGALTPVSIEPANGTLQIDAPPGFEVWLDGERVGETPLAPLEVSLGTHDVRLTHPQAGERRQTVVVTKREPARVTAEGK